MKKHLSYTLYDTTPYESSEDDKILEQIKNPIIAIDLILERRFKAAEEEGNLSSKERKSLDKFLNSEFQGDTETLDDYDKRHLKKIRKKIRKGERITRYPNLSQIPSQKSPEGLRWPDRTKGCENYKLSDCFKCGYTELQPNSNGQVLCLYQKRLRHKEKLMEMEKHDSPN
jgi:hypothetical protein